MQLARPSRSHGRELARDRCWSVLVIIVPPFEMCVGGDARPQTTGPQISPAASCRPGAETRSLARTDRRPCPVLLMFQPNDRVDEPSAVLRGCALQPPCQREHRRLKVVGCAHQPRGTADSARCPGDAQLVGVVRVVVQDGLNGTSPSAHRLNATMPRYGDRARRRHRSW